MTTMPCIKCADYVVGVYYPNEKGIITQSKRRAGSSSALVE